MYSLDPIYQLLSSQAQVHANLYLAHAIGMTETLIFNVLIAKSTWYINNGYSEDGWFYCTVPDLQASTTFGIKTQRSAIKHLVEEGLIEYKVAGLPQKRFFRIINDNSVLSRLIEKGMTNQKSIKEENKKTKSAENAENSNSSDWDELKSPMGLIRKSNWDELESPNGTNYSVPMGRINQSQTDDKNNNNKNNIKKRNEEKEMMENPHLENPNVENSKVKTDGETSNLSSTISVYEEIISHLNEKAGTNYKPTSADSKKHINARLSEGYTTDDFFTVIDKKCSEWLGTDMEKYLRPITLFGTKFESYLNSPVPKKTTTENSSTSQPQRTRIEDMLEQYLLSQKGKEK